MWHVTRDSRVTVCGCGFWRCWHWQVTDNRWQGTHDTWLMTHDMWQVTWTGDSWHMTYFWYRCYQNTSRDSESPWKTQSLKIHMFFLYLSVDQRDALRFPADTTVQCCHGSDGPLPCPQGTHVLITLLCTLHCTSLRLMVLPEKN